MADLDSNGQGAAWGIFPGDTAEGAVQAAVTANAAATAPWNGTLLPGMNHRPIVLHRHLALDRIGRPQHETAARLAEAVERTLWRPKSNSAGALLAGLANEEVK